MGARWAPSTCSWFPCSYISWRLFFWSNGTTFVACNYVTRDPITSKEISKKESQKKERAPFESGELCRESCVTGSPGTATGTLRTASDLAVVLRGTAEPQINHHCWPP